MSILIPVPPESLSMTSDIMPVPEGVQSWINCTIVEVKPLDKLDLQLLNGSMVLPSNGSTQSANVDEFSFSIMKSFAVTFTR